MNLKEAAQQALNALEKYQEKGAPFMSCDAAVAALRAALAEDVPETNFGNMAQEVDLRRDDIIRMAQQCGFGGQARVTNLKRLEQFAALVAAAEREACARVAEAQENRVVVSHPARIEFEPNSMMARKIAAVIRARAEK